MILTCHSCPRQICCSGPGKRLVRLAALFGWRLRGGGFVCSGCGEAAR
jgi:hypothetical protein